MADATSSHLDSYIHVYDNGSTARLHVTPWDRNTVADGYWQTVNTIQPLINRDIYLADAIDKLAEQYTVYKAGQGIDIIENVEPPDTYTISLKDDYYNLIPKYVFDETYFTLNDIGNNTKKVGIKISDDASDYIYADNEGIHANVDYMMYDTSAVTSKSAYSAMHTSAFTYTYTTATLEFSAVTSLPENPEDMLYIIG